MRVPTSEVSARFTESVIREMTRLIVHHHGAEGINLAQGFPDFAAPQELKDAACAAIQADINQYAITWGSRDLRAAVAEKAGRFWGMAVDPEREVTVCCGSTETMIATLMATLDSGDEVVIFQPFYENYGPDCLLAGATPRYLDLEPPDWRFDPDALRAAFTARTKAVILNSPHNPTGKVYARAELELIAELCREHDVLAITDEIYEHLVYEGEHIPIATLPGMAERTITISGLSKSYSVTGWRVGYAIAPEPITNAIRKVHDFLTVGAAAPLQAAGALALGLPDSYYASLLAGYRERRAHMLETLETVGIRHFPPAGAYYVMCEIAGSGFADDVAFTEWLVRDVGVACVPGSSFYADPHRGRDLVRFAFPKRLETLARARERLLPLRDRLRAGARPS
jgi:aspartate/methionine/tyrosine aminotransferase